MKISHNNFSKTSITFILTISIVSVFLIPRPTNAIPVVVTGGHVFTTRITTLPSDPDFILNQVVKPAVRIAVRIMLQETTNEIVRWIQGGKVGYIKNPQSFLRNVADKAGGEFLNQLSGVNLCGNIGAFLQISLRTPPGLQQKLACSLTDIVANVNSFYRNFNNGGWPAFIKASVEPQNNPYGAYLIALDAKITAEGSAVNSGLLKLNASYPFLGFEVAKPTNCVVPPGADESEAQCTTEYETLTPGQLIASQLSKAAGSGIDYAINSNDIDAALSTIVTALINRIINSPTGLFAGSDPKQDPGNVPLPGLENTNFFVARVQNNLLFADAIIVSVDSALKDSYQQLFIARRNPPLQQTEESIIDPVRTLEDKITRLHQSKQEILTVKTELLSLKRTTASTANVSQLENLSSRNQLLSSSLNSIASRVEITATPPTSAGNLQWNTVQEIQGNLDAISSSLTLIDTMIEEANRIASSNTSATRRSELERLKNTLLITTSRPLQNLTTSLTLLKNRLERAVRNEDVVAISSEAMLALEGVNVPMQNASDAVQRADVVLKQQP